MTMAEEKLKLFISENNILAEHLIFSTSCHSVEEAAKAVGTSPDYFVKSICFIDSQNNLLVVIVTGKDNASTSRVAKALGIERPRMALPEEISDKTGYSIGGVPPFGFQALFLIDSNVMEKTVVYAGGGSENSLVKISPQELQKANDGKVCRVRR